MRYAIYFTPPSSDPLLKVAANWLGRNAFTGQPVRAPQIRDLAHEDFAQLTESPRRYGFHATLKAPFHLADGVEERELLSGLMHFASSIDPVEIPKLQIACLDGFFALVPAEPLDRLNQLANDVVVAFDRFRAPPGEQEIKRRNPENMSVAQRRNLKQWGYPYVFEDFRFHMTLTGPVPERDRPKIEHILSEFLEPVLEEPVEINNLALFTEAEPGFPFEIHSLHSLAGTNRRKTA
jgi:putative phosphonate metabolism protein